jgi:hypothetical protein
MEPYEVMAGPYTLYLAPTGTAFPLLNAAPAAAWIKIGTSPDSANYDEDGIVVSHVAKYQTIRSAGRTGPIKTYIEEEDYMISLKLMDVSLEAYSIALNKATISTVAAGAGTLGTKKIGLSQGSEVATYALLARGPSPYGDDFKGQYMIPRAFQSANQKPTFKKAKPAILELEFTALENMAAASARERFGWLEAQHQAAL